MRINCINAYPAARFFLLSEVPKWAKNGRKLGVCPPQLLGNNRFFLEFLGIFAVSIFLVPGGFWYPVPAGLPSLGGRSGT